MLGSVYAAYGYVNIETPAVERNDVLLAKGWEEASKQIFGLYGLAQGKKHLDQLQTGEMPDTAKKSADYKDYALHFDLTVPFARYVAEHSHELYFPFKRYQIQKAWRGERQQKGRYKEFYQADVDIIALDTIDFAYEIETAEVLNLGMHKVFEYLGLYEKEVSYVFRVNHKAFLEAMALYLDLSPQQKSAFLSVLDDFYKMDNDAFLQKLQDALPPSAYKKFVDTLDETKQIDTDKLPKAYFEEALETLDNYLNAMAARGIPLTFDPYIVRGLDYYTGMVFEIMFQGLNYKSSIGGGGAYGNLLEFFDSKTPYVGVGGSIGPSRLMLALYDLGYFEDFPVHLSDFLIYGFEDCSREYLQTVADTVRGYGYHCDVLYASQKLPKVFAYAEKKHIPFAILLGWAEEKNQTITVRNMQNKEQNNMGLKKSEDELQKLLVSQFIMK